MPLGEGWGGSEDLGLVRGGGRGRRGAEGALRSLIPSAMLRHLPERRGWARDGAVSQSVLVPLIPALSLKSSHCQWESWGLERFPPCPRSHSLQVALSGFEDAEPQNPKVCVALCQWDVLPWGLQ